jgi:sugar lactone lactonase YvrE
MTAEHVKMNPLEGDLFALDVGVAGVPESEFTG